MSEHVSNAQVRDTDSGDTDSGETWSEAEIGDPLDTSEPSVDSPSLQALADAVESLRAALTASQRAQEHQQALLDKLHDEKEQLREAEQRRQRDPVLRDLIQLSDTCLRTSRQWRERADVSQETAQTVATVLGDAAEDVHLILERQGIEDFAPMVGDKFVRSESKAVGTQPTADEALDGLVAAVRKSGYRLGGRLLRFSEVVVWRLERSDANDGNGEAPTPSQSARDHSVE